MTVRRSKRAASSGNRATVVSGPVTSRSAGPASRARVQAPGAAPVASQASTAAPDDGGRLKPRPNSPWVSGVVVSGTFSGAPNPAATGTSGQPHRSRIQRELREAWHTVVLPAVVVTAASSISPARCRPAK